MGVGAGAVTPAALGMVGELFDERDFPKVFGLMGVIQVVSNLIGPLLGGFLNDTLSWRWGILLFLPLEFACVILILLGPVSAQPDENGRQTGTAASLKKLDWAGTILLSSGMVCLVLGLQLVNWTETIAGICLAVFSPVMLVFFVRREKRCREPLLPLDLLKKPEVRNVMILIFLLGIVNNSSIIYLSLYFQNVLGKGATDAGILLLPMLISAGIASALYGKVPKRSIHVLSLLLWLLSGLSFAGISLIGNKTSGLASMIFSVPVGLCIGFLLPHFLGASQTSTDNSSRSVSGGLVQLSRNLGGALGASLLGIWISGTLSVETGLTGTFLSLTAVSLFAFLYTYIHARKTIRRQQNGSMV
jgi:predicted MFS family arabinose efflux permease